MAADRRAAAVQLPLMGEPGRRAERTEWGVSIPAWPGAWEAHVARAADESHAGQMPPSRLALVDQVEVYRRLTAEGCSTWKVAKTLGLRRSQVRKIAAAA